MSYTDSPKAAMQKGQEEGSKNITKDAMEGWKKGSEVTLHKNCLTKQPGIRDAKIQGVERDRRHCKKQSIKEL